jgi:hypothetical protein
MLYFSPHQVVVESPENSMLSNATCSVATSLNR